MPTFRNKYQTLKDLFFKNSSRDQIEKLLSDKNFKYFHKGETLYTEGQKSAGVHCIYEGKVKITKKTLPGKTHTLHNSGPGDIIGLTDVVNKLPHSNDAIAEKDTGTCFIPIKDFLKLIKYDPDLSLRLMKHICQEIRDVEKQKESLLIKR